MTSTTVGPIPSCDVGMSQNFAAHWSMQSRCNLRLLYKHARHKTWSMFVTMVVSVSWKNIAPELAVLMGVPACRVLFLLGG